ncbi:hypothetical protein HYH03_004426 [Edaphochlamys debaryana]|uniref:Uncharacterized protein n=1 Tax=Edaphochlamys debaryana TaxID=47281 RepID=A0A835YHF0_9CHLO|nr:hypothetical protein HYH03_004426 [Edaphochlamys debaryana]|eukprot:KAG2497689.1 hypothetical protein HYH03_004426 [Edaphochlamys debaryana]
MEPTLAALPGPFPSTAIRRPAANAGSRAAAPDAEEPSPSPGPAEESAVQASGGGKRRSHAARLCAWVGRNAVPLLLTALLAAAAAGWRRDREEGQLVRAELRELRGEVTAMVAKLQAKDTGAAMAEEVEVLRAQALDLQALLQDKERGREAMTADLELLRGQVARLSAQLRDKGRGQAREESELELLRARVPLLEAQLSAQADQLKEKAYWQRRAETCEAEMKDATARSACQEDPLTAIESRVWEIVTKRACQLLAMAAPGEAPSTAIRRPAANAGSRATAPGAEQQSLPAAEKKTLGLQRIGGLLVPGAAKLRGHAGRLCAGWCAWVGRHAVPLLLAALLAAAAAGWQRDRAKLDKLLAQYEAHAEPWASPLEQTLVDLVHGCAHIEASSAAVLEGAVLRATEAQKRSADLLNQGPAAVSLLAAKLNARIDASTMPSHIMQLAALVAIDSALRQPNRTAAPGEIVAAMKERFGGGWTCVVGPSAKDYPMSGGSAGTFMAVWMHGMGVVLFKA